MAVCCKGDERPAGITINNDVCWPLANSDPSFEGKIHTVETHIDGDKIALICMKAWALNHCADVLSAPDPKPKVLGGRVTCPAFVALVDKKTKKHWN